MGLRGQFSIPSQAQVAGTANVDFAPPMKGAYTRLNLFDYTNLATLHTLFVMRALGLPVTLTAAAAAAQAVFNLNVDPGDYTNSRVADNLIAANDYGILELDDGTYQLIKVSSVSGLAITATANLAYAAAIGKRFWFMGITTDSNPADGKAHPSLTLPVSARTTHQDVTNGLVQSLRTEEPLILFDANATNAGVFNFANGSYWFPGES